MFLWLNKMSSAGDPAHTQTSLGRAAVAVPIFSMSLAALNWVFAFVKQPRKYLMNCLLCYGTGVRATYSKAS